MSLIIIVTLLIAFLGIADTLFGDNVWVRFSPNVRPQDFGYNYTEEHLVSMMSKVSHTFRRLLVPIIKPSRASHPNYELTMIPKAAASHNELYVTSDNIQVMLTFHLYPEIPKLASVSFVEGLASEANKKFPGTATHLCILDSSYFRKQPQEVGEKLREVRSYLGQTSSQRNTSYTLSTYYHENCQRAIYMRQLEVISSHLDTIYFRIFPFNETVTELGVNATVAWVVTTFEKCSSVVKSFVGATADSPKLGLMTMWPNSQLTETSVDEKNENLVSYWEQLAQWSAKEGVEIIFWQMFDTFNEANSDFTATGWWRLNENLKYKDPKDYVFVEKKRVVVAKSVVGDSNTTSNPKGETPSSMHYVFIIFGVVLVVSVTSGIMVYNKLTKGGPLEKEDIANFFDGLSSTDNVEETEAAGLGGRMPYNTELEIPSEDFLIERGSILGHGEFGIVFRGTISFQGNSIQVAIKTTKPPHSPEALKGLMDEVKIMSYLGAHDNIISIMGAHTADLSKGKLFLFVEICVLGSLRSYLISNRAKYAEMCGGRQQVVPTPSPVLTDHQNLPSLQDLKEWTYEIACGMEFLSFKKVVHGDLAARNVLLTGEKIAKISDFGLSKRLSNYKNYVATQSNQIPWKWMSPEALRALKLNEKSDVWSYGVTIWEIYSLGEGPYGQMEYTADFVTKLEEGLRLEKPSFDLENIHDDVMLKCWHKDPNSRSKFAEIREGLCGLREADYVDMVLPEVEETEL